jgi:hypothetical protein
MPGVRAVTTHKIVKFVGPKALSRTEGQGLSIPMTSSEFRAFLYGMEYGADGWEHHLVDEAAARRVADEARAIGLGQFDT